MFARLAPLEPPFAEEVASALERLMGGHDVEPLALFRTLAHHDALLERFRQVGSTVLSFGRLDPVDRETVIHRTTARCGAAYEWGVHAAIFAPAVGGDAAWLRATWHGRPEDPAFTPRQTLLVPPRVVRLWGVRGGGRAVGCGGADRGGLGSAAWIWDWTIASAS